MSYRFALRPAWLASHVFAAACIVAFVALGFWQLDRHDQRAARNAAVEARADLPAVPVAEGLRDVHDPEELRFRHLVAEGTYGPETLVVDNRSLEGLPGGWILAPLRLDDGSTLVVNRGFLFAEGGTVDPPPVPDGSVRVEGTVATWEGSCGVRRGPSGVPVGAACLSRDAAEDAFGAEVLPVVVQRQESQPAEVDDLQAVPMPELDAGPHRSYAFQWFAFAVMTAVVYALILRRRAAAPSEP